MITPELIRDTSGGVTLLGDPRRPCGVTLAFTERTGGVSAGCYSSLNLGNACGDKEDAVAENRRRALAALGACGRYESLVNPLQVHGDHVVVVGGTGLAVRDAQLEAANGADAIVCVEPDVPVLLCYADCVPIVLVANGGFAVVHSGWRGTIKRIAAKALRVLMRETGCDASTVLAYIGPHIGAADYEVSHDLANRFRGEFGSDVLVGKRNLDLARAVKLTLEDVGVGSDRIACVKESTASHTDRFFSYRAEGGSCGRHGALAYMPSPGGAQEED